MYRFQRKFELSPRLKFGVGRGYSQNQVLKLSAIVCLLLAIGLTVNAVRLVFQNSSSTGSGLSAPQVLGATDSKVPEEEVRFIEYKVAKGDTLFNVSQTYNISWTTLATLNNLQSPYTLKPGQVLKIPKQ